MEGEFGEDHVQGIPSVLGPEMELFHMPFERHYYEINNKSKIKDSNQNNSISGYNPEGMLCNN